MNVLVLLDFRVRLADGLSLTSESVDGGVCFSPNGDGLGRAKIHSLARGLEEHSTE